MKELQIFLTPQPGAKPEFLATVRPAENGGIGGGGNEAAWNQLLQLQRPRRGASSGDDRCTLVLEGYTRDGWAWKPSPQGFVGVRVRSTDGRKKLPGFLNYLSGRQKCAYGRLRRRSDDSGNAGGNAGGVVVVSYIQSNKKDPDGMDIRICFDTSKLKDYPLKPLQQQAHPVQQQQQRPQQQQQQQQQERRPPPQQQRQTSAPPASAATKKKGGGLLGALVGAQQRTNKHMEETRKAKQAAVAAAASAAEGASGEGAAPTPPADSTGSGAADGAAASAEVALSALPATALRTSQQVFSEFREVMHTKMLDFDVDENQEKMEIVVSLSDHTAGLSLEDKSKVTMDVLKYMVYEAAEEVNEEWVAYKEPSEFMDEAVFTIYKEGAAPDDVLEEMNMGELPEEVRAEQRAMAQERARAAQQAESRQQKQVQQEAHKAFDEDDEEDLEALNTNKRDRRTIEDYERERREASKRSRPS